MTRLSLDPSAGCPCPTRQCKICVRSRRRSTTAASHNRRSTTRTFRTDTRDIQKARQEFSYSGPTCSRVLNCHPCSNRYASAAGVATNRGRDRWRWRPNPDRCWHPSHANGVTPATVHAAASVDDTLATPTLSSRDFGPGTITTITLIMPLLGTLLREGHIIRTLPRNALRQKPPARIRSLRRRICSGTTSS
jgi:hypothetical protein